MCGYFTTVAGQARNHLARINADGSLDSTFAPAVSGDVYTLALQPDGKIVIAGYFSAVAGQNRMNIARLNANGSLDTAFNPGLAGWSGCDGLLNGDCSVIITGDRAVTC